MVRTLVLSLVVLRTWVVQAAQQTKHTISSDGKKSKPFFLSNFSPYTYARLRYNKIRVIEMS